MLGTLAIIVALLVAGILAYAALRPSDFTISRSATIAASPDAVFAEIDDLRRWDDWSPWAKLDPHAVAEFSGAEKGEGAMFRWSGNNQIGTGAMTIVESLPYQRVRIRLEFLKPMRASNEALFTFEPRGAGTRVTWQMTGNNSFSGRLACTFMNMDKMVGGQFEQGLAAIKAKLERAA